MEILTGIMIAILIYYSGKLIMNGQFNINNFFSFLSCDDVGISTSKIFSDNKYWYISRFISWQKELSQ